MEVNVIRLQITLEPAEADALLHLAVTELRDPREQARHIVRSELMRLRLLQSQAVLASSTGSADEATEVHDGKPC